jgi:hypothetical protein
MLRDEIYILVYSIRVAEFVLCALERRSYAYFTDMISIRMIYKSGYIYREYCITIILYFKLPTCNIVLIPKMYLQMKVQYCFLFCPFFIKPMFNIRLVAGPIDARQLHNYLPHAPPENPSYVFQTGKQYFPDIICSHSILSRHA